MRTNGGRKVPKLELVYVIKDFLNCDLQKAMLLAHKWTQMAKKIMEEER